MYVWGTGEYVTTNSMYEQHLVGKKLQLEPRDCTGSQSSEEAAGLRQTCQLTRRQPGSNVLQNLTGQ